ncbi:protein of unknown function [Monaibacterium marinum]|uniref:DUF4174 domain-containing protein n=1 Tax=Pontivivens marinum TaxID=1690039 RepID=A0A2C9CSH9_9RHOB|nr:DUF4174 domain-containing protein [Monaibacterium marinum]SOH94125.1 protein of unknown function [Monaibacterium marinum]
MLKTLIAVLTVIAVPAAAQDDPLAEYLWVARPVIVFADSPRDPRVVEQIAAFEQAERDLEDRDVIVIIDTDADSALRDRFHPRDFQLVLIGKDGEVKYRKPDPVPIRELTRVIDRTPLRQDELRAERALRLQEYANPVAE